MMMSRQRKLDLEAANELLRQEVSERKAAEEEVRRLNRNLEEVVSIQTVKLAQMNRKGGLAETILKDSKYAVWTLDLNASITGWNSAAEDLFGYRAEEVLGLHASLLAPAERATESAEVVASMRQGEETASHDSVRIRKSGELMDV